MDFKLLIQWALEVLTQILMKNNSVELCEIVPDAGETYVIGAIRSRDINIQRWRVRNAIQTVDPLSRVLRRTFAVVRRVYIQCTLP